MSTSYHSKLLQPSVYPCTCHVYNCMLSAIQLNAAQCLTVSEQGVQADLSTYEGRQSLMAKVDSLLYPGARLETTEDVAQLQLHNASLIAFAGEGELQRLIANSR